MKAPPPGSTAAADVIPGHAALQRRSIWQPLSRQPKVHYEASKQQPRSSGCAARLSLGCHAMHARHPTLDQLDSGGWQVKRLRRAGRIGVYSVERRTMGRSDRQPHHDLPTLAYRKLLNCRLMIRRNSRRHSNKQASKRTFHGEIRWM